MQNVKCKMQIAERRMQNGVSLPSLTFAFFTLHFSFCILSSADDWPQWGGTPARNNVSPAKGLPVEWDAGQFDPQTDRWLGKGSKNIRWAARLGKDGYGSPVVAGNKVFCATNNDAGYLARYPATVDLGCLLGFDRTSGRFLWQYSAQKLRSRDQDYGKVGMCSCPLVEGNRLWIVTNRSEVVCLDTSDAAVIWSFDMVRTLGTVPRYMSNCSVTSAGDLLFVCTSNGRSPSDDKLPAPQAPSFIALDKHTGKLAWADNSPGENILDGQWSSPAYGVLSGVPQVIFGGGDGWLYSFLAAPREGKRGEEEKGRQGERETTRGGGAVPISPSPLLPFSHPVPHPSPQAPLEVRLQPQGVGLGRPRLGPTQHHRLHARDLRRPRLYRHGPGPRIRRRAGGPLAH